MQTDSVLASDLDIRQLCELAVDGLVPMFDAEKQLFCYRLKRTQCGLVAEGLSRRYTIMALLGLHRQRQRWDLPVPIDTRSVLEGLLQDNTAWIENIGDLGLLLWLCAMVCPEHLKEFYFGVDVNGALGRSHEAREGRTMELAWFLSGLAHANLALPREIPDVTNVALRTYHLLTNNQGDHGIFGHLARNKSLAGLIRGGIGSFADQVYPIYALAKFSEAFNIDAALRMAQNCAEAICRVQGPKGQWWWHYDSSTGEVFEHYPVYSVHQDGMAPMALFALSEATGLDFSGPIYKGLQWITGTNELRCDLRDAEAGVIWRSLYCGSKYKTILSEALGSLGSGDNDGLVGHLRVKFECRPYHFGWLLYAFAGRISDYQP
jgi:hypothetical protein